MSKFRVGVDIGGTFTDITVIGSSGEWYTKKVSSTVDDYSRAITEGIIEVSNERQISPGDIIEFLHGTTVGSNAILELKGARTGLITTRGFRDVLEIRTLRMPRLYDMSWVKPLPLVERYLRLEVDERITASGEIERLLVDDDVRQVVGRLLEEGVEAIAVCLIHSYANPVHEHRIRDIVMEMAPDMVLSISSEVLPEIKEYERTSTTVINSYVKPIVKRYLTALTKELSGSGVVAPVLLMQSNGGLISARTAAELPIHIIESGPAAGVIGAQTVARRAGIDKAISFDMGGTTAKAAIIENGEAARAAEYSVGGGIIAGSRLLSGAGYMLKVPAVDLAEVGAGGGSILSVDAGGALQIGPESAGASPGPVCYDIGGSLPTVTDANVTLGYINPSYLVSGELKLNADKAKAAIAEKIAGPLRMSVEQAAYGAHLIAASNMIRAIKAVSSERGRDPREFTIVAFGGNGPIFAAGMASTLGIKRVIIPISAGVFSSVGLLSSDVEYHLTQTHKSLLGSVKEGKLEDAVRSIKSIVRRRLEEEGFVPDSIEIICNLNMRYKGQSFELGIAIGDSDADIRIDEVQEAFGRQHQAIYGHRADIGEPTELVSISAVGRGKSNRGAFQKPPSISATRDIGVRKAYFGPEHGWLDAKIVQRAHLQSPLEGPCIVEEYDCTCVVPPDCRAVLDEQCNIVLSIRA